MTARTVLGTALERAALAAGLAFALATTGCVGLHSETGGEGMVYHLPKSLLTITVREYHDTAAGRKWYQIGGEGVVPTSKDDPTPKPGGSQANIATESIPDLEHRYVVNYRASPLHDDRVCLSRRPNGLLHDIVFASDDRTSEIVFNVARFVASTVGGGGEKTTGFTNSTKLGESTIVVRSYTSKIDPFNKRDIAIFNEALHRTFKTDLGISFSRMKKLIEASASNWPQGCAFKEGNRHSGAEAHCAPEAWQQRCGRNAICYRTKLKLPVDLVHNGNTVDINYADIINAWDIGAISVTRAALVHKITKLRFEDGALVAAIIRKPSEIEQASLIPLHVMNAALSVPSGLWAKAWSLDSAHKTEVLKQLAAQDAQVKSVADNQRALFAAVQAGTSGPIIPADIEGANPDCREPGVSSGGLNWISHK